MSFETPPHNGPYRGKAKVRILPHDMPADWNRLIKWREYKHDGRGVRLCSPTCAGCASERRDLERRAR